MPSPAIVVEWRNASLCGSSRPRRMLAELFVQLAECAAAFGEPPQLIIAFEPARECETELRAAIAAAAAAPAFELTMHALPTGTSYADYKNLAFASVRREVVIFLDSDVVPEPGWLHEMLRPFARPATSVVTASIFMDADGFFARAVRLYWFYDVRRPDEGLAPTGLIFASCVAFRREVFARFPFPAGGFFRAKIHEHATAIWRAGIPVLMQRSARAAHSSPTGVRPWLRRALCQGHDFALLEKEPGYQPAFASFRRSLGLSLRRIRERRSAIGAGWGAAAASAAMAGLYYSVMLAGHLISRADPRLIERYFAI